MRRIAIIGVVLLAVTSAAAEDVVTVREGSLRRALDAQGVVVPRRALALRVPEAGVLVQRVERGRRVKRGELLARLDPADARLAAQAIDVEHRRLQAKLQQVVIETRADGEAARVASKAAQLAVARAGEQTKGAEQAFATAITLRGKKAIAEAESARIRAAYLGAKAAQAQAQVELEAQTLLERKVRDLGAVRRQLLELQLKAAEIRREVSRLRLSRTELRAPFGGVITRVMATVGERVAAGATVLSLVDDLAPDVELRLTEATVRQLEVGQPAQVTVGARRYGAVVRWIAPVIERGRRTVALSLEGRERPALGARVEVQLASRVVEGLLLVPRSAVALGATPFVWVMGERGPVRRDVHVALVSGDLAGIDRGLKPGERVMAVNPKAKR